MNTVIKFLSGNVPGGLLLLLLVLLAMNLAIYSLYKKSGLFEKPEYKKKSIRFNLIVIILYLVAWIVFRPASLPPAVVIQPFQVGDSIDYTLTEGVEQQLVNNLSPKYRLHPWSWFYLTARQDSLVMPSYRAGLAKRLKIDVIIGGRINSESTPVRVDLEIRFFDRLIRKDFTYTSVAQGIQQMLQEISRHTNLVSSGGSKSGIPPLLDFRRISQAKLAFLDKEYDRCLKILDGDTLYASRLLAAQCLLKQWLITKTEQPDQTLQQRQEIDPVLQRMERLLLPYSIRGNDTEEINLILGQMYLYRGDYETASICLNKAITQNPYDSRLFYYLSFLLSDRFKELGYKTRSEILEHSVTLDPGYSDGVFELARELYEKGSGVASALGTQRAMEILQNYLALNSTQPQILKLLAKIYLQTKYIDKAIVLFQRIMTLEPDSANNNYNLGICYFNKREYNTSKQYFEKAIKLEDHRDSYLYLGAIYKIKGEPEKALYYFRERIRRKQGDDDYYAKEAMRGVRDILEKQQAGSGDKAEADSALGESPNVN